MSASNFADGAGRAARIDEPRMARRLTQPEQRLEDLHLRLLKPVALNAAQQRGAVVIAQLVVQLALRALQLAPDRQLGCATAVPGRPALSSAAG